MTVFAVSYAVKPQICHQTHEKGLLLCLGISPSGGKSMGKEQEPARVAAAWLGSILSSHV